MTADCPRSGVDRRKHVYRNGRGRHKRDSNRFCAPMAARIKKVFCYLAVVVVEKKNLSGLPDPPGFLMLDLHHHEAMRRDRRTRFRTVPDLEELVNVFGREFTATHVEKCAHHFADHVAQERAAFYGEDQLLAVRSADKLGRVDFTLCGAFFVVFLGASGGSEGREIVRADEARRGIAHGFFVESKRIMEYVPPDHRRHNSSAIDPVTIRFATRGPARIEIRANFFGPGDSNRRWKERVQRALKILRGEAGLRSKAADLAERVHTCIGAAGAVENDVF